MTTTSSTATATIEIDAQTQIIGTGTLNIMYDTNINLSSDFSLAAGPLVVFDPLGGAITVDDGTGTFGFGLELGAEIEGRDGTMFNVDFFDNAGTATFNGLVTIAPNIENDGLILIDAMDSGANLTVTGGLTNYGTVQLDDAFIGGMSGDVTLMVVGSDLNNFGTIEISDLSVMVGCEIYISTFPKLL
jgi:hypothetical protein